MGPKKFIAANATEALKLVRQQVGGDAMVLSTRDTPQGVEILAITPKDLALLSQAQRSQIDRAMPPGDGVKETLRQTLQEEPTIAAHAVASAATPATSGADLDRLLAEIAQVKSLVQAHLSDKVWGEMQVQSVDQAEAVRILLNAGFSPALCSQWAQEVQGPTDGTAAVTAQLQQLLEQQIRTLDPLAVFDAGGVFAFIGPTGVGKTTALAKIAARCVLRYGREQLALLTTDTFRIGAQEQLKVYAKIIGVPVVSLRDSDDLAAKLKTLSDRRVILLDTAGVNQRDIQMLEQSQLLHAGAPALKRILVMSSTTDLRTQEEVIVMHQQAALASKQGPGRDIVGAIITKTDEAAQLGPVLDCLIRHRLPLLFLANGQRVPEDLSQANVGYLAHRALHPRLLGQQLQVQADQVPALMADQLNRWAGKAS